MKRGILALLATVIMAGLFAQHDPVIVLSDAVVMENRIKVPLSRKPAAITVIDSSMIRNIPGLSLADILRNVTGVDMRQRGVNGIQTDAGIRGSTFDQVLVLVNGIRISDSQTGHHNFNLPVDPDLISRIEVYKGPSARVFGQNAFAGAINIITRSSDDNFVSVKAAGGSYGLLSGAVSSSLNTRTTKNHLSASSQRSSGYRYNTDYSLTNIFYQGEVLTGAGTVTYLAGLSDRKFGANGFYSGPAFPDQYEEITTSIAAVTFSPRLPSSSIEMTSRIYWRRNDDEYILRRDDPGFYKNNHLNNSIGADVNMTVYSRAGISGAGIEFTNGSITSSRLGDHTRRGISLFAEHRFMLLDERISVTPGLQLNHSTGFGSSFLPGIDIGWLFTERLMLFVNSGYTYRVPTFTDLYYADPGNLGNASLKPEYSISNEAGIKTVRTAGFYAQASLFIRKGYNLIDRVKDNEADKWMPVNIRETLFKGLEADLVINPRLLFNEQAIPVKRLSAGYLFTMATTGDSPTAFSRFALDNLRNQFVWSTDLTYVKGLTHTITMRYTDRVSSDSYFVADTRFSLSLQNLDIFADISNLTGTVYHETWQVTMPGRGFRLGLAWKQSISKK
jgi:vitamin B12 transporter